MNSREHASTSADGKSAVSVAERAAPLPIEPGDRVLAALNEAAVQYEAFRGQWELDFTELKETQAELRRQQETADQLGQHLEQTQAELARERKRVQRQKERAERMAEALKQVHRALFDGNVFDLILRACMKITQATRGLYVTAWGADNLRVRAAIDVDGYPQHPPSDFLRALCRKVLTDQQAFVANRPEDLRALGQPSAPGEAFHNCLAAPAVLHKHFSGVVVLADKLDGPFDQEDVDSVLSVGDQASVALENRRLQQELLHSYFAIVGALADAVEAKDPYTHGHCELVARYARLTARRLNLPEVEQSVVCYGGLLHDVGKIGVSDGVLHKPGRLMPAEWELMRSHVRVGHDIVAHVPVLERIADVVLHHHERYDGSGYPDGLKGEQISLTSRIVCVVDAYCAMTSRRSYKESMSDAEARAELVRCKGTHFDPAVVDAFLAVLDDPEPDDPCPDGCGLPPEFLQPHQLQKVVEAFKSREKS